MAHEVENMFSVKQTPWHKLGVILKESPTAEDAIIQAGLDWKVEKRPLFFNANDGYEKAGENFAVVRDSDNSFLGTSGKNWQPLQNTEAFSFFDPFIESGEASFETAGSLAGGQRVWILAKINRDPIEIVKGDEIEKYVLLSNRHYSGQSVIGALTPIRVVCANTEAMAVRGATATKNLFRASHSKRMHDRLAEVQVTIAQADKAFKETAEFYKRFAKKQINTKQLQSFINNVFEFADVVKEGREQFFKDKMTKTIFELFETGLGSDIKGVRGTAWGAYNSVTEYVQHYKKPNEEQRLEQSWFGAGMDLNMRAFNASMELVAA